MEKVAIQSAAEKGFIAILLIICLFALGWGIKWFVNRGLKREEETVKKLLDAEKEKSQLIIEKVTDGFTDGINKIVTKLSESENSMEKIQRDRLDQDREWNEARTKGHEKLLQGIDKLSAGLAGLENKVNDNVRRIDRLENKKTEQNNGNS